MYIIYDQDHSDEELFLIQSIQGIVAKKKPLIYRNRGGGSAIWQDDLINNYQVTAIDSLSGNITSIIEQFSSSVNGYILCNSFDNSSNVAISIAGITECITVPESLKPIVDSVGLPMRYDVRDKNENWVLDQFGDQLSKQIVVYQREDKSHFLGDYSIFCNAFHFYDSIDSELTERALQRMFPHANLLGWGDDEYQTIRKASEHGVGVLPADWAFNLSMLTNFDVSLEQEAVIHRSLQTENKHIACFLMSDGDNIQWLLNLFADDTRWFGNTDRGVIPVGWTIPPTMSELAPTVLSKIYNLASNTFSGNDQFVAGPSGKSYLFPSFYQHIEQECEIMNEYLRKSDLHIVNIIGADDSYHYLRHYTAQEEVDALFTYDFTDYSKGFGKIMCDGVKPIVAGKYNLWGGFESCSSIAEKLNKSTTEPELATSYSLIPVHAWSYSVDSLLKIKSLLNSDVQIVSPQDFAQLISDNICKSVKPIERVYPNPNRGIFDLEIDKNLEIINLKAYTNQGIELPLSYRLSQSDAKTFIEIQLDEKYTGFLTIQLQTNEDDFTFKVITL